MKKRLLPIILVCLLLAVPLAAGTTAADNIIAGGDCSAEGSSVRWSLDNKGNLVISGKGAMAGYPAEQYRSVITSLTVNSGVTEIGVSAFYYLDRLTKVTLPDGLLRVNESAFYGCSSLTEITLPNSVSSIGNNAFYGCSNLLSCTISDNITSIGNSAFADCDHLTKIAVPKSVKSVSGYAFYQCDRLQSVTILGEIHTIKSGTFQDCPALTEVTIPHSVTIIEQDAFANCPALMDVYYTGTESMWEKISIEGGNPPLASANIHFGTSVEATYRVNALSVADSDGKALTAIPQGSFLATLSVTNLASSATPIVFLASYDANGQYQGLMYVTVEESVGATAKITLPVDNSGGKIAQLKAFAVNSFADMTMIGNPVSFPA